MVFDINSKTDAPQLTYPYLQAAFQHFEQHFIKLFHICIGVFHATSILQLLTLRQERSAEIESVTKKCKSLCFLEELDIKKFLNATA